MRNENVPLRRVENHTYGRLLRRVERGSAPTVWFLYGLNHVRELIMGDEKLSPDPLVTLSEQTCHV